MKTNIFNHKRSFIQLTFGFKRNKAETHVNLEKLYFGDSGHNYFGQVVLGKSLVFFFSTIYIFLNSLF